MTGHGSRLQVCLTAVIASSLLMLGMVGAYPQDPLPSWNNGPAKQAIISFVDETTDKSSPTYVEPNDRIATFDQDGTLWTEHPLYAQGMFALDRLGKLAPRHPEWKQKQPFKAVIDGDREAMSKFTESDWMEIIGVTHARMSTEEFLALVKEWIAAAKAPRFNRPYTDLVYQPILEVMKYLRENGFERISLPAAGKSSCVSTVNRCMGSRPSRSSDRAL